MKVAIIHPWFPQYRVGFFEHLVRRGAEEGIDISIFYGDSPPEWKDRNDARASEEFTRLPTQFFHLRGRTLNRKSLRPFRAHRHFDLVIVEQAVRNLETYQLCFSRVPLAYWGHGKTYTMQVSEIQERLKQWLTRRGAWFFAYTSGGVEAVVNAGYPRMKTTVVQNSIDTSTLRREIEAVDVTTVATFNAQHDLHGKTALFIGGLDSSKRLSFLLEAADAAHKLDSDFRLLIVGAGIEQNLVECAAASMACVKYLGSLFGPDKALAITASQVMAMPGRVGLVAVDSFAGATPIVTTGWPWHAPEFEYLESGVNAVVAADNIDDFARALVATLQNPVTLAAMQQACIEASDRYTVEAMVENFIVGIQSALESRP
ncbi:glycosyltransferase [Cryobacterium sp. TMT2-18-3]|uniref:Glycosyltransferase n=1 Tax=Cryobacterium sandaracinum TaxID=1259247 RepID=A0ABY2JHL5_9MICO|nr:MULTISPECIES: glycosyltransferase family 4 protein [Cryobacterium]TFC32017.1 glycosyltransferase [Cryobacterium sp. TMT2-18-2]TFC62929.1 glycosyltransferase [Cryobacterium sp. TMT2-18-3]TFD06089.1 glycosyltransferase [Cryobacterium sandaracinum]